jgi:hypothetical protein
MAQRPLQLDMAGMSSDSGNGRPLVKREKPDSLAFMGSPGWLCCRQGFLHQSERYSHQQQPKWRMSFEY